MKLGIKILAIILLVGLTILSVNATVTFPGDPSKITLNGLGNPYNEYNPETKIVKAGCDGKTTKKCSVTIEFHQ
jgi:hypothetical protein